MASDGEHVVVIGAGIIGLSCALALLEDGRGVTLVAEHLHGDESVEYTSPWAGAHWRPHSSASDKRQCRWDIETYREWMKTIEEEKDARVPPEESSGLAAVTEVNYWSYPDHTDLDSEGVPSPWYKDLVRDFQILDTRQLSRGPNNAENSARAHSSTLVAAAQFLTVAINVPKHLAYLCRRVQARGGVVVRCSIPDDASVALPQKLAAAAHAAVNARAGRDPAPHRCLPDAPPPAAAAFPTVFVNATGLRGASFAGPGSDAADTYPVRGQTVLVRGEAAQARAWLGAEPSRSGSSSGSSSRPDRRGESGQAPAARFTAYALPRPGSGTTVLGGSYAPRDASAAPDAALTRAILRRCRRLCPELLVPRTTAGAAIACTASSARSAGDDDRSGKDGEGSKDGGHGRDSGNTSSDGEDGDDDGLAFDVLRVSVGLRPARDGGARVERERESVAVPVVLSSAASAAPSTSTLPLSGPLTSSAPSPSNATLTSTSHLPSAATSTSAADAAARANAGVNNAKKQLQTHVQARVVHAYGHAGAGFQNAVGVARDVVRLVRGGGPSF